MIKLFLHGPLRLCALVLPMLTIGSCQVMDSTISYEVRPDGQTARRCDSALGSYSLPFSTITVKVTQAYKGTEPVDGPLLDVSKPEPHPDRDPKHLFCLDFLENGFSDDTVSVAYSNTSVATQSGTSSVTQSTGMLSVIASKSIDRTADVIRNLIQAIFVFASRDAGFLRDNAVAIAPVTMTEQSVDPFDLNAMAALNRSLHDYGYCLTFGAYTYDTNRFKPDDYCNNPSIPLLASSRPSMLEAAESQQYLVKQMPVGIFYRPRQPYSMFVYVRNDPDRGGPWELRKIDTVMLENISPILVLKVNRAIFAEYRTVLAFDRGNLVDVCIGKGSEVAGALQIPLDIIYGIVSLPSEAIAKTIETKTSTKDLVEAQKKLLTLQNSILAAPAGTFPGADEKLENASLGKDFEFAHHELPTATSDGMITSKQSAKFDELCPQINNAKTSL